ncbi:MAG: hypothetical protein NT157_03430 [Candidatus Micrarchaeota archaeon]|nr:hypothetical protein [Candidatus Micrarchaeota archaeon]
MDERKATFATLRGYGVEFEFEINNEARKGEEKHDEKQRGYFGEIMKVIGGMKVEKILIAGPGFAKDNLKKFIGERDGELLKRIAFDSCSSAEKSGVYELLKRGAVEKVAGEQRAEKEFVLIEKLIAEIAKAGLVAYGKEEVAKALDYGAVDELLVVDELLRKDKKIEELLEKAEKTKVKTTIFSSENSPADQLSGFGGIAALLRFRIS